MICQPRYIDKIVETAGLADAKLSKFPLETGYFKLNGELLPCNDQYRKLIGMLLYLTTNSRPDIAASVSILSQKVAKPRDVDLNEVKRIVRYLKGTRDLKLYLSSTICSENIYAFSDANWAEDREDRKSNSGYFCSVNGGAISWSCTKQKIIAMSSTEAEYVALNETCKEITWIKKICQGLQIKIPKAITIYTDSQSSMSMIMNQKFSNRTKHIDTKYHFIRDKVDSGEIDLKYVPTETNVADMMTKPLGSVKLSLLRGLTGVLE